MRVWTIVMACAAALVTACEWSRCDEQSIELELPEPGDAVEVRVAGCPSVGEGEVSFELTLVAEGQPTSSLALAIDGVDMVVVGPMQWATDSAHGSYVRQKDCDSGEVITLRRIDADAAVSYTGTLTASMTARRSCELEISVTPL